MKYKINVNATAGELFQGRINSKDLLVSLPINLFNELVISSDKTNSLPLYMQKAKDLALKTLNISSSSFNIERNIKIKEAMGFGSSTADIVGTILLIYRFFNKKITYKKIASLCAKIEPTDSSFLGKYNLFDFKKGIFHKKYKSNISAKTIIATGKNKVKTAEASKIIKNYTIKELALLKKSLFLLEKGFLNNDIELIAKASTISADINQRFLKYKDYSLIRKYFDKISVAHSGNLLVFFYNDLEEKNKIISFINKLDNYNYFGEYIMKPSKTRIKKIG